MESILSLFTDERVLGEHFKLLAYGMVMSEPDAESQQWHQDNAFIFGDLDSLASNGVAGMEYLISGAIRRSRKNSLEFTWHTTRRKDLSMIGVHKKCAGPPKSTLVTLSCGILI